MKAPTGIALVIALLALDQLSKFVVEKNLPLQSPLEVLPVLSLYRTHNTGIAFSLFSGIGDVPLIVLTLAITAFVIWLWTQSTAQQNWVRTGYAFIIGGALGNLIDRVRLGHVVDFILVHAGEWSFAVFNLADSFITVGASLVVLGEVLAWRRQGRPGGTS